MGQAVIIRTAIVDDALGVATVHVSSWRAAYRGLIPDDVLDRLSIEQRKMDWRRVFQHPSANGRTLVAEREGEIVGWASCGPARDEREAGLGELWGLYAHPNAFSTGVGHALITAVEAVLRTDGFGSAYLWVLDGNERAARFYERHGWIEDGNIKLDERPTMSLLEHRRTKLLV